MSITYDQEIYENSISASGSDDHSPFTSKQLLNLSDLNNGNYSNNSIVFDAVNFANSGKYLDMKNAYIAIPLCIQLSGKEADIDFTANEMVSRMNFELALKNCNTSLVESFTIQYGNSVISERCPNINQYLAFRQHTELSQMEEEQYGATIGYAKDNAQSWQFLSAGTTIGKGMSNNISGSNHLYSLPISESNGEVCNEGMLKRQRWFKNYSSVNNSKTIILGTNEDIQVRNNCMDYIKTTNKSKHWYRTAIIPLKHLSNFFASDDFPSLVRATYFKISLTINQCSFSFQKGADGTFTYDATNFSSSVNGSNPLLVSASYFNIYKLNAPTGGVYTPATNASNTDYTSVTYPSGSAPLKNSTPYQVSISVVKTNYTHAHGESVSHPMNNCRLYVNAYTLNAEAEKNYLSLGQKRIKYNDITYTTFNVSSGNTFNQFLASLADAKRLILIPNIETSANLDIQENQSPFSTCPATPCPTQIDGLQVSLGGVGIFPTPMNYNFECFYNTFLETNQFSARGVSDAECVGRITKNDWENLYKYYVIDLRRGEPLDGVIQQISISGSLKTQKAVTFHVFIEYQKSCVMDIASGMRLS